MSRKHFSRKVRVIFPTILLLLAWPVISLLIQRAYLDRRIANSPTVSPVEGRGVRLKPGYYDLYQDVEDPTYPQARSTIHVVSRPASGAVRNDLSYSCGARILDWVPSLSSSDYRCIAHIRLHDDAIDRVDSLGTAPTLKMVDPESVVPFYLTLLAIGGTMATISVGLLAWLIVRNRRMQAMLSR